MTITDFITRWHRLCNHWGDINSRNPDAIAGLLPTFFEQGFVAYTDVLKDQSHGKRPLQPQRLDETITLAWVLMGSGQFDGDAYLHRYPDVVQSGTDPVIHYAQHGWQEGRIPQEGFDPAWYAREHLGPARGVVDPFLHYILIGKAQALPTSGAPVPRSLTSVEPQSAQEQDINSHSAHLHPKHERLGAISYSICSGWYSNHKKRAFKSPGSDFVRSVPFFDVWHQCVDAYTSPEKIFIVESASPLRPNLPDDSRIEWIRLSRNFGHSLEKLNLLPGSTRTKLAGLMLCFANGDDYAVSIEQGTLFYGKALIENQIEKYPTADIINFSGAGSPQPIGAISIMRSQIVPQLVYTMCDAIKLTVEKGLSLEKIFHWACGRVTENYVVAPVPFGRSRPLDFSVPEMYAKHMTDSELLEFVRTTGLGKNIVQKWIESGIQFSE
jgi:hypothetical protein